MTTIDLILVGLSAALTVITAILQRSKTPAPTPGPTPTPDPAPTPSPVVPALPILDAILQALKLLLNNRPLFQQNEGTTVYGAAMPETIPSALAPTSVLAEGTTGGVVFPVVIRVSVTQ